MAGLKALAIQHEERSLLWILSSRIRYRLLNDIDTNVP